jgi:hypothetical protein
MMKHFFNLLILVSLTFAQSNDIYNRWDSLDKLIRDRKISKDAAIDSIKKFAQASHELPLQVTSKSSWVFPLSGYTKITYRQNGNDYRDNKFDYFQGGEFKGHPAHDIFIFDADSNGVEDVTGEKVNAVAMVNGVVISVQPGWKKGDFLRSGNYIKLFDPGTEAIFYYSHLDSIFVTVGQFVNAGDPIAYIGRTGRKAINGRTHLHIAYYKIEDGNPEPVDIMDELRRAELRAKK